MEKKYIELFELIEDVLKQQKAQKLRGLNDYNMVNVVRKATDEVGMHSNVIFSLINPNGLHYQNDLFLNRFIEIVLGFELKEFGKIIGVKAEEQTDKNRRIDFTIKSENYFIGIEMKVNAGDLKNQIAHYDEYLSAEADTQKVMMYYLTKDGKDAPLRSKGSVSIEKVSFQKHILKWLDACQNEVRNITNLNVALEDYKNIVKKITGKYKGNVVNIKEKLLEKSEKDNLKLALIIDGDMKAIKGEILWRFFEQIRDFLIGEDIKKDITKNLKNKDRVITKDKCKKVFTASRNKPTFFGYYFNFGFGDNLYFNVEYGKGGLFYGIIRLDSNCEIQSLEDRDKKRFKKGNSYRNWTSRYWKSMGGINNLADDNILDFKNSKLKDEILDVIEEVRKSNQ